MKKFAGTLSLVGSNLKKDILTKAYTSSRRGLCCRQISQDLKRIESTDTEILEGTVQIGGVRRQGLTDGTQPRTHLRNFGRVFDRVRVFGRMKKLLPQQRIGRIRAINAYRSLIDTELTKTPVNCKSARGRTCNMNQCASIRGTVGNNRRNKGSIICTRRRIDNEGIALCNGLNNILLPRGQIACTALFIGVTVIGIGLWKRTRDRTSSRCIPSKSTNHAVLHQNGRAVKFTEQKRSWMFKNTNCQFFTNIKVLKN